MLSPQLLQKVREGTFMALIAIEIALTCHHLDIPFVMENPITSVIWTLTPMLELRAKVGVHLIEIHYCAFDMEWRKPTGLLTNVKGLKALASRLCPNIDGLCTFTGKEHKILRGRDHRGTA